VQTEEIRQRDERREILLGYNTAWRFEMQESHSFFRGWNPILGAGGTSPDYFPRPARIIRYSDFIAALRSVDSASGAGLPAPRGPALAGSGRENAGREASTIRSKSPLVARRDSIPETAGDRPCSLIAIRHGKDMG
jgi:hypothetical protein